MTQQLLINLCIHPGCGEPSKNKAKPGYCEKHYYRIRRHNCSFTAFNAQGPCSRIIEVLRKKAYYLSAQVDGQRFYVHRLVMSSALGRVLHTHEEVHHKDGDTLNNRIDNLEVMFKEEHYDAHRKENKGGDPF